MPTFNTIVIWTNKYEEILNLYKKNGSLEKSVKDANITLRTYYRICKGLKKPTVSKIYNQDGGRKNIIDDEIIKEISENCMKNKINVQPSLEKKTDKKISKREQQTQDFFNNEIKKSNENSKKEELNFLQSENQNAFIETESDILKLKSTKPQLSSEEKDKIRLQKMRQMNLEHNKKMQLISEKSKLEREKMEREFKDKKNTELTEMKNKMNIDSIFAQSDMAKLVKNA